MSLNRRQFLHTGILGTSTLLSGCNPFSDIACEINYINLTGRYIDGIFRIGRIIGDSFRGPTFTVTGSSARGSLLIGQKCQFLGVDIYSRKRLDFTCEIPSFSKSLIKPAMHLSLRTDNTISPEWREVTYDSLKPSLVREVVTHHPIIPLLYTPPENSFTSNLGIRQRPVAHTLTRMTNSRSQQAQTLNKIISQIISPSLSPHLTVVFNVSNDVDLTTTCRVKLDLRKLPAEDFEKDAIWFEALDRETLGVARFSTGLIEEQEIRQACINGEIVRPTNLVAFRGVQHPVFNVEVRKKRSVYRVPDLRFDDEIESQGLASPVAYPEWD